MSRRLLIDDYRNIEADQVARTYDEGIKALEHNGPWDVLYLDHDLGDPDPKKTGYNVACWIEQHEQHRPKQVVIVSSNPVGVKNIELALSKFYTKIGNTLYLKEFIVDE